MLQGQLTGSKDLHVKADDSVDAFDGAPGQDGVTSATSINGLHDGQSGSGIQSTIEGFQVGTAAHTPVVKTPNGTGFPTKISLCAHLGLCWATVCQAHKGSTQQDRKPVVWSFCVLGTWLPNRDTGVHTVRSCTRQVLGPAGSTCGWLLTLLSNFTSLHKLASYTLRLHLYTADALYPDTVLYFCIDKCMPNGHSTGKTSAFCRLSTGQHSANWVWSICRL